MAPEVLSCEVVPASDVWAAGIMTYQLLSGRLPFNDERNPEEPALSLIWYAPGPLPILVETYCDYEYIYVRSQHSNVVFIGKMLTLPSISR